jgi:hypothetical protein
MEVGWMSGIMRHAQLDQRNVEEGEDARRPALTTARRCEDSIDMRM